MQIGNSIKLKIGEKNVTFTKDSCSTSKDTASNRAKKIRDEGKTARVIYDSVEKKHCVVVGPRAKARGRGKK